MERIRLTRAGLQLDHSSAYVVGLYTLEVLLLVKVNWNHETVYYVNHMGILYILEC